MAVRSLRFVLTGEDKSAAKSLDRVGKKADGLGRKLGGLATLGGAGLGAGAVVFAKSSISAYSEAEKAQAGLAAAYKKSGKMADVPLKSLQDFNSALATKTTYDDDAIASGEAVLSQFGLTGKQLKGLTPLLLDYATATGKDLPEAARDLGKASQGQGKALKNIGIKFKDLKDPTKNLTQLMDGLNKKVGGLAGHEGKTASGQVQILKNRFGELQESVGQQLMPVLTGLVGWLNEKGVPALQTFADNFKDGKGFAGELKDTLKDLGGVLNDYVLPVFQWFGDHPDAAKFLAVAAVGGVAFVKAMKGVAALQGAVTVLKGIAAADTVIATTSGPAAIGMGAMGTTGAAAAGGLAAFALTVSTIAAGVAVVGGVLYLMLKKANSPGSVANANAGTPNATINIPGQPNPVITFNGKQYPAYPSRINAPSSNQTNKNKIAVDGRASGGQIFRGGTYLTGEKGPELITAGRSGYVHTATKTRQMFHPNVRLDTSQVSDDRLMSQMMMTPLSAHQSYQGAYAPAGMREYITHTTKISLDGRPMGRAMTRTQRRAVRNGAKMPFGL